MSEPVLVVHGVATRDPEGPGGFYEVVRRLSADIGSRWKLIPVYWGDLGAVTNIKDVIPTAQGVVRGAEPRADAGAVAALLGEQMGLAEETTVVRSVEAREDVIVQAAADGAGGPESVRGREDTEEIRNAVREEFPRTEYLRFVSDREVLAAVGQAIGEAVGGADITGPGLVRGGGGGSGAYGTTVERGAYVDAGFETRGPVGDVSRAVLRAMDRAVGRVVGKALGRVNESLRRDLGGAVVSFVGDIFVYQRNQAAIQQRLWDAIAREAPGFGTPVRPIDVVAHSLGGVIAFDAATRGADPLHIRSLVTFGSQSGFFQVVDPRPALARYERDQPVELPPTIQRWVSLWEPLDVLAFLAGPIFQLSSGGAPADVPIAHLASYGLNTHGVYWTSPELADVLRDALAPYSDEEA